ncbi:1-acyl-sn-glycerol-3-phosphate acyltransferase [Microcoleus sp. FACHB-1515]|uniref:lysophospholipid acyltransferase family protein n=1 Tax=Cyanophyceae TaxID=3028117 RepID=UPI001683ACA5|nr:lysophospholipid acyltransferase family protein [Microcoleus sp. FACHB-1515]MBD2089065.1 1-acyl-sn-glycerol-3-phosphate acyltransferase [Microcoleus sp. FACHB-1515]
MSNLMPLLLSRQLLTALGTRMFVYHQDRVPRSGAVLVVSNHRSFTDAPLLMAAIDRPIRFACHHYMGEVPVMRDVVTQLGCFPLATPDQRQHAFFGQATELLQTNQAVGIFPEGTQPMVKLTPAHTMGNFQRGFAHLALRAPVRDLAILPIAIVSEQETNNWAVPLRMLHWFDPSEPLFDQSGWHPMVLYQRVTVAIGHPIWITADLRSRYQGRQAKLAVNEVSNYCYEQIEKLLLKR